LSETTSDAGHAGQRPRSLLTRMATAGPVQQVHQVQWMVPSPYRIGTLAGYVQDYGSSSKSKGKAHGIGPWYPWTKHTKWLTHIH